MDNARACETPGCYHTAYGGMYCGQCLGGNKPELRGPVTIREAMYARLSGPFLDKGVTASRLRAHSQPLEILEPNSPKVEFDTSQEVADGENIVTVVSLVDAKLIEHFHRHPGDLKNMDRRLFEELVAELFRGFRFEVELTQQTRDGGKDIIAIRRDHGISSRYLIECKRPDPEKPVGVRVVRELYGIKMHEKATKAIAVTTTHFTADAHAFEEQHQWELELKEFAELQEWIATYLRMN